MRHRRLISQFGILLCLIVASGDVAAAEKAGKEGGEAVDVDDIKKRYWARGDSSQMGVVQNRVFTKSGKFSLGVLGGLTISDPFLAIRPIGGSLGYHFNEFFGANLLAWKYSVGPSGALEIFREKNDGRVNINPPIAYFGGEGTASLIYGKLSLMGASIIYYDLHLDAGAGVTLTESGDYFTPHAGIGQRFYLTDHFSVRFDYRMMYYREELIEKVSEAKLGQSAGFRDNFSHTLTLGVDFMFGF